MKGQTILLVVLLVTPMFAISSPHFNMKPFRKLAKVDADLCPLCLNFMDQALNILLNIILQGGVVGTCGEICNALATKTGSKILGTVCDILCDVVGVEEFIKLVEAADLDPIYYCELAKVCPIFDGGDAQIVQFDVSPKSGPQGQFSITFTYTSKNGTGTGEIALDIDTVDKIPLGQSFLHEMAPNGTFSTPITLKAEPNPDCDPSQGPCEQWLPGNYTVKVAICNGQCGSKHPHSKIYDTAATYFTLTQA